MATDVISKAATDAYDRLKALVLDRLRVGGATPDGAAELVAAAATSESAAAALTEQLARVGLDDATVQAAVQLRDELGLGATNIVNASQAKGVIVGNHAIQHNTFN